MELWNVIIDGIVLMKIANPSRKFIIEITWQITI